MSPKNLDVVEIKSTKLLDPDQISQIRLRPMDQRTSRDWNHPDINLFAVMYDKGPEWADEYVDENHPNSVDYEDEDVDRASHKLAMKMTEVVQWLYDISLTDTQVGNMYGMTLEYARLALGYAIPVPASASKAPQKGLVMRRKRIRQYVNQDNGQNKTETGE